MFKVSRLSSNSEGICLHSVFIVHPICLLTEIYIPLNGDSEIEKGIQVNLDG